MPNTLLIQKVTKVLKDKYQKFDDIRSAYIYGKQVLNIFINIS